MSSTLRPPRNFYRIYNKIISIDFDIPFLSKLKSHTNSHISITENKDIFNSEFKDGYTLNKDKAFYSKGALIQTKHNKERAIEYFLNSDLSEYDKSFKLLSHPMALSLVLGGSYVLHSSAIEIGKKAYIFIGPSGSGKSYTINSLLKYGRLLTEDILHCTYENESFYATPGIPVIKLEHNQLTRDSKSFKINGDTRSRDGSLVKDFDYKNTPVKIEACFILKESEITDISRCSDMDAYKNLFLNSFCALPKNKCIESEKKLMGYISNFIKTTPIFIYKRKKNHDMNAIYKFLNL